MPEAKPIDPLSPTPKPDEVFVERVFSAPRDLVFQAWAEADRLVQWWGPKGFPTRVLRLDFEPGGVFHYGSVMPNGHEVFGVFLYREIDAPERIVFLSGFADKDGDPARHPMMPDWPRYIRNEVILVEEGGKTRLTMRGCPHEPTEAEVAAFRIALQSLAPGLNGTFDQLEDYLANCTA